MNLPRWFMVFTKTWSFNSKTAARFRAARFGAARLGAAGSAAPIAEAARFVAARFLAAPFPARLFCFDFLNLPSGFMAFIGGGTVKSASAGAGGLLADAASDGGGLLADAASDGGTQVGSLDLLYAIQSGSSIGDGVVVGL